MKNRFPSGDHSVRHESLQSNRADPPSTGIAMVPARLSPRAPIAISHRPSGIHPDIGDRQTGHALASLAVRTDPVDEVHVSLERPKAIRPESTNAA